MITVIDVPAVHANEACERAEDALAAGQMLRQEGRPLDGLRFKVKEGRDYRKRIYLQGHAAYTNHLVLLPSGSRSEKISPDSETPSEMSLKIL